MATVRDIQKNATRPTSVVIMLLILQGFQLTFPNKIPENWENFALNVITIVGGTGIIDKAWRNRKEIKQWIINIFKKKGVNHGT